MDKTKILNNTKLQSILTNYRDKTVTETITVTKLHSILF